jgi:signal transduction histidine kinase
VSLQEALQVAGYLLGSVLHSLLLWLVLRRPRPRRGERLFAILVCAVGLWNLGQFLEVFFELLLRQDVPVGVRVTSDLIAYLGLLLLPSSLLHCLVVLLVGEEEVSWLRWGAWLVATIVIYAPLCFFPQVIERTFDEPGQPGVVQLAGLIELYGLWFLFAMATSAVLSVILARKSVVLRARRFYMSMVLTLVATCALLGMIFVLRYESVAGGGLIFEALIILASVIPSAMFGYYVHRYDDVEFFLRRSVFYVTLVGATVLAYLWGISELAAWLDLRYGLHHKVVEAALILGLVVLFHPFRRLLQRAFNRLFFKRSFAYQRVLSELVRDMAPGTAWRVHGLIDHVADSIAKALDLVESEIVLVASSGVARHSSAGDIGPPPRVEACYDLLSARDWRYFRLSDLGWSTEEKRALDQAHKAGAEAVFAVRHERRIVALLLVGKKRDGRPLFAEEIDLLSTLVGHLGLSLESLKLYEDKALLEKQLWETERRLALGRFSSSVAHRVKNPLSSIKAITQAMALDMGSGDEERRCDLEVVVSEVDRLNGVIDQLLDYAEVEARTGSLSASLSEAVGEVADLFQHEASLFGVRIEIRDTDLGSARVRGSRADLHEIVSNLVQNGIHSMTSGGELRIDIAPGQRSLDDPTEVLCLKIVDQGEGIPEAMRGKVFEPFYTTKAQGTGLGLAIVRRRLQEIGGAVYAGEREDGEPGTELRVELQVWVDDPEATEGRSRSPDIAAPGDSSGPRS